MPSHQQWETVKQQCNAFRDKGYLTICDMQSAIYGAAPRVKIIHSQQKQWLFSDPDWNVVIAQLATLWKNEKANHRLNKMWYN